MTIRIYKGDVCKELIPYDCGTLEREEHKTRMMLARQAIDHKIEALVGLKSVKSYFDRLRSSRLFDEKCTLSNIQRDHCHNLRLTGNPGTGKTTVAKLYAEFMYAYGYIRRNILVSKPASSLMAKYQGHTTPAVAGLFTHIRGGALFLDEASSLSNDAAFNKEALKAFLIEVEMQRNDTLSIIADYKAKMALLMQADDGVERRFPKQLHIEDYEPADLVQIAIGYAQSQKGSSSSSRPGVGGYVLAAGVDALLLHWFEDHKKEISTTNAGLARNKVEAAILHMKQRHLANEAKNLGGDSTATDVKRDSIITNEKKSDTCNDDNKETKKNENLNNGGHLNGTSNNGANTNDMSAINNYLELTAADFELTTDVTPITTNTPTSSSPPAEKDQINKDSTTDLLNIIQASQYEIWKVEYTVPPGVILWLAFQWHHTGLLLIGWLLNIILCLLCAVLFVSTVREFYLFWNDTSDMMKSRRYHAYIFTVSILLVTVHYYHFGHTPFFQSYHPSCLDIYPVAFFCSQFWIQVILHSCIFKNIHNKKPSDTSKPK
jgi:hypothetical protein